jgi:hypothetical protein
VDATDAFDPISARAAGVELTRVLWVRAPRMREALRSVERLLEARGFALVFFDAQPPAAPPSTGLRLLRRAAATGTALVLLVADRWAGTSAELVVETRRVRPHFREPSEWFEGFETHVELTRHRSAPPGGGALLELRNVA